MLTSGVPIATLSCANLGGSLISNTSTVIRSKFYVKLSIYPWLYADDTLLYYCLDS